MLPARAQISREAFSAWSVSFRSRSGRHGESWQLKGLGALGVFGMSGLCSTCRGLKSLGGASMAVASAALEPFDVVWCPVQGWAVAKVVQFHSF